MPRFGKRLLLAVTTALLVVTSTLPAHAAKSAKVSWRAEITFEKNHRNPQNSLLIWELYKVVGGKKKLKDQAEWRTGSGMGGQRGTNSCINDIGWLPNGSYRLKYHPDYRGNLIKGRAFQLDDKRCANGNRRFALFIHTEQGAGSRQCADRHGDQLCRWEFPKHNDYRSAGCIKLSPKDLTDLSNRFRKKFRAGVKYGKSTVVLRVIDRVELKPA